MKRIVFSALACTLAASASLAAPAPKESSAEQAAQVLAAEKASGTIKKVNAEGKSFVLLVDEKEVTITYGAATKFLLDGKEVDAARLLQVGGKVNVTHEGSVAQKIEGTSKVAFLAEQASGTIKKVNAEGKSFVLSVEEKDVTITYGAATKFFLDGKEVDAARLLQVGGRVNVTHEGAVAQRVEGTSKTAFLVAEQVSGTIMNVNVEAKSFIVVVEDKETTISWGPSTKFILDGKEVDAARLLQVGTKVTISHEKNVALKVESGTKS